MSELLGREAELEVIAAAVSAAAAGTPTLLLLTAEAGGGKTALLRSLLDSPLLPRRRIRVAYVDLGAGEGDPVLRAADVLTLHAKFARVGGRRNVADTARRLLPDWVGAIPVWGEILGAITKTVQTLRRRNEPGREKVPEEIEDLRKRARRRPAAILFDNAEQADPAAADRIHQLVGGAELGTRLLVVAACRPAPPGAPPPPIARASARLDTPRRVTLSLRPLSADAVRAWLERRLNGPVAPALVASFVEQTGGRPAGVARRIDQLIEAGAFHWELGAWEAKPDAAADAGPGEIDLGPLGPDVLETLSASALLGEEFESLRVARMLSRDELWVEDRLAAAARLGLLDLVDDARELGSEITSIYRFTSASTRASLRRSLDTERRTAWEAGS